VRKTHRHAQALYFRWDDPTVYSDDKGKTWRNKDLKFPNIKGKFVHVGRDFQCRCVAIPVFETEGIDQIPVGAVDWKAVDKRMTKKETAP
jgi:uncharacterized protein with gpF-like domain